MPDTIAYLPVASSFLPFTEFDRIVEKYSVTLAAAGVGPTNINDLNSCGTAIYFVITGGTENTILDYYNKRSDAGFNEPLLLITHSENNSLPAAIELLARCQQDGKSGRIVHLQGPDDRSGLTDLITVLNYARVQQYFHAARIGLIGAPSDWLVASQPNIEEVNQSWGIHIIPLSMTEIETRMQGTHNNEVANIAEEFTGKSTGVREPVTGDIDDAVRVYLALRALVQKEQLTALTVRCFDLVINNRTTGCFALSQLNDDGIIAACEGDLVSTIGMLLVNKLLDIIPWMANPATIDKTQNSVILAHCTIARGLVRQYQLRSHFESGLGVGIAGALPTGPVTLLRIGGRQMELLWLAEGNIINNGNSENLCRTQVEIKLNNQYPISELLVKPLGNHIILVFGYHAAQLKEWWELFKPTIIND